MLAKRSWCGSCVEREVEQRNVGQTGDSLAYIQLGRNQSRPLWASTARLTGRGRNHTGLCCGVARQTVSSGRTGRTSFERPQTRKLVRLESFASCYQAYGRSVNGYVRVGCEHAKSTHFHHVIPKMVQNAGDAVFEVFREILACQGHHVYVSSSSVRADCHPRSEFSIAIEDFSLSAFSMHSYGRERTIWCCRASKLDSC